MSSTTSSPPKASCQWRCWVVTDGRRGIENQALGLAEAIARLTPLAIERKLTPQGLKLRKPKLEDLEPEGGAGEAPDGAAVGSGQSKAPDLWVSCGRASLPYAERAHEWLGPDVFVVQLQDPRRPLAVFDLVVPPLHDRLEGPNVFPVIGSPNRVSPDRLAAGLRIFAAADKTPPRPRAAVLIGGDSKRHRLSPRVLASVMHALERARAAGWSLLMTTSRRTPKAAVQAIKDRFGDDQGTWLWTGEADGPNPYDAFLAAADVVLVTKDSTNMITEAASAGKPVLLLPMDGVDGKYAILYASLARRGNAKLFAGDLTPWPVEPLLETDRAAAEVLRRMTARGPAAANGASS
jgi:mitochondrial fission protein ELM1